MDIQTENKSNKRRNEMLEYNETIMKNYKRKNNGEMKEAGG